MKIVVEEVLNRINESLGSGWSKYASYRNHYRWHQIKRNEKIDDSSLPLKEFEEERSYICFGAYIYDCSCRNMLFEIEANRKKTGNNNLCWWTEEEITFWIDSLRQEAELDFSFKVTKKEKSNLMLISFNFSKLRKLQQRLVLFWTRNLYELPASFYVLDALILKRDYFPEESLVNLLTLTTTCGIILNANARFPCDLSFSQNFSLGGKFITLERLRRCASDKKIRTVTSIFGSGGETHCFRIEDSNRIFNTVLKPIKIEPKDERILNADTWIKYSENRFRTYSEMYPVFKSHELTE